MKHIHCIVFSKERNSDMCGLILDKYQLYKIPSFILKNEWYPVINRVIPLRTEKGIGLFSKYSKIMAFLCRQPV